MNVLKKVKRSENFVYNEVDGDLVMMDIKSGNYVSMNSTGKDIWNMLDTPQTVEQIINRLYDMYSVEKEVCEKEVLSFVEKMQNEKIIVVL